jgi:hypothetical protein
MFGFLSLAERQNKNPARTIIVSSPRFDMMVHRFRCLVHQNQQICKTVPLLGLSPRIALVDTLIRAMDHRRNIWQ